MTKEVETAYCANCFGTIQKHKDNIYLRVIDGEVRERRYFCSMICAKKHWLGVIGEVVNTQSL